MEKSSERAEEPNALKLQTHSTISLVGCEKIYKKSQTFEI